MKWNLASSALALVLLLPSTKPRCAQHELISRADSLFSCGNLYASDSLVHCALSEAIASYESEKDQPAEIWLYWVDEPRLCRLRDFAEAESLFEEGLALKQRISDDKTPELAEIMFDLAELKRRRRAIPSAIRLHESALRIRIDTIGRGHPDVARSLRGLGDCALEDRTDNRSLEKADSLFEQSKQIFKQDHDLAYPDLAFTLRSQAIVAYEQGRYEDAEKAFKQQVAIIKKARGANAPEIIPPFNSLAKVCKSAGRLGQAERYYRRAIKVATHVHGGPDNSGVANALCRLGSFLLETSRYEDTKDCFRKALDIRRTLSPSEPVPVAECLNKLASVCIAQTHYREGDSLAAEAIALMDSCGKSDDKMTAEFCYTRGKTCQALGRIADAEALYERALLAFRRANDQVYMATCLDKMAALAMAQAEHAQAEHLSLEAIRIASNPRVTRTVLANSRHTLGNLYLEMGRYEEAEECYASAEEIYRNAGLDESPEYATILNSLGALYADRGVFREARHYYESALEILNNVPGSTRSDTGVILHNLGHLCRNLHEYSKAEDYYKKAIKVQERVFSENHPGIASSLDGLGIVYMEQGRMKQAEQQLKKALDITESALGQQHPEVAGILESYSRYCRLDGDAARADTLARRAFDIRWSSFCDHGPYLPEGRAMDYAHWMRMSASNYLSCCMSSEEANPSTAREIAEAVVACKGQVSSMVLEVQRWARTEGDSATQAMCSDLRLVRNRLSDLFLAGSRNTNINECRRTVDSLQSVAIDLETNLAERSARFRALQHYKAVSLDRIISDLPPRTVLVEYLRYDFVDPKTGALTPRYLAVILTSEGHVSVGNLGDAATTEGIVASYCEHLRAVSSRGSVPSEDDLGQYVAIATRLGNAILGPVEPYLAGCNLLLLAPDADLNLISFGALPCGDGDYLIEKVPIQYLSAARDVVRLRDKAKSGRGLLAFGDPAYEAPAEVRMAHSAIGLGRTASASSDLDSFAGSAKRLEQSRDEINSVATMWARTTLEPSFKRLGLDATEDNFKALAPGKRVIHIATHGYFRSAAPPSDAGNATFDTEQRFPSENPLLFSGLIFAGGLRRDEDPESLGCEDGQLTAYEISALDLGGVDLVVLSACETALGEVIEGEGVYDLRRAFQVAGARTVVSSLWQVSDKAARRMMERLYARTDESLAERIRHMQMDEIEWLHRQGLADHPFNWAPFIATGDWQ